MKKLMKTKAGVVLFGFSVLAVWMLLVAQHVQAHKPDTPTCSGLPTAENFFVAAQTAAITPTAADLTPALSTRQGMGSAAKGGNTKYRYAKITVPQLAAGELRVFDTRDAGINASDAVLCQGTSTRARYRTSHPSSHSSAESARTSALTAQERATDVVADIDDTAITITITESGARSALNSAAIALRSAASALRSAATALTRAATTAGDTAAPALNEAAGGATTAANAAYNTNSNTDHYDNARVAAGYDVDDDPNSTAIEGVDTDTTTTGERAALVIAATNLDTAAEALRDAANALHDIEAESTVFQLRAEVRPGDQEYILVTTLDLDNNNLAVQFHGAIAATSARRNRSFTRGSQDEFDITITAPGLLTLETTGSTDTKGMLDDNAGAEVAYAESGGSGGNFKMFVPVEVNASGQTYGVVVEGQTLDTFGEYTVGMDFKVAMNNDENTLGTTDTDTVNVVDRPTWGTSDAVAVAADDTTLQIKKIAEDGNTADADYFLFTATTSGFLTVNANDDDTNKKDADTKGTLYGAKGEGPMGEMRVGEIATDANSGPGNHFAFTVPVEADKHYLVKVEGTDGQYFLEFSHDPVPSSQTVTSTAPTARYTITDDNGTRIPAYADTALCPAADAATNRSNEICASTGDQHKDQYLLNIAESGTLYVHSTGTTDVDVFLFGPAGSLLDSDADSGTLTNFDMATKVAAGLHLLEVRGKTKAVRGYYEMFVNFVAGEGPEPTDPVDPVDPVDPPLATDATGSLDDPPNNGSRSGIGLIRGWVCQATNVEVRIRGPREGTQRTRTISTPYGSVREQAAVDECQHNSPNIGFAAQFNYNILAEGTYTAEARADGQTIETNTFTVVRISDQEYLTGASEQVEVRDFPITGDSTILLWDEASQNFQIVDHQ